MKFLLTILIVMAAMALRDLLGTAMTIYGSRGDGERAGRMDALGDAASMLYTVVGVDTLNKAGFSLDGIVLILAVAFTSYNTTKWATNRISRKKI